MITWILAEIVNDEPSIVTTGAISAVASMVVGVVAWITRGRQGRNVKIEGEPSVHVANETLGVRLYEAYVTRNEFMEFKGEIKSDVREMRGSYDKLTLLINERDKKLSEMIERVAAGAFEGRRRIHEEVNAQGKAISAIGAKADISKGLGTLGKALMTQNTKPKTP